MTLPKAFTYQEYERQKVRDLRRTAVIAPPGSGKTRPIIEGVNDLDGWNKLVLVLCSGPAIATWLTQVPLWLQAPEYSDYIRIVRGNKGDRIDLWEQAYNEGFGTFVTNFAIFYRDFDMINRIPWITVIADEYHKTMRNHKIDTKGKDGIRRLKTYGMFKKMTRHTPNLVPLTGSLVRRNASSMFTAFQMVDPFIFRSYWKFVSTYCFIDDTTFGKQVHGVKNAQALRTVMDRYFAYVPPEVVADALPEGRRYGIDVEPTPEQQKIYRDLQEEMLSILPSGEIIVTPTVLAKITRQRQLLCCPRILDPSLGMGAGFETIVDRLDNDNHVAIFVPFRPACDFVQDELQRLGWENTFVLRGGVSPEEQIEITQQFRETRGIMICTIAYAESFDLETCKTSYFLGYDLTVDQNEQAEGRTRRAISEHEFVTWGYIKTHTPLDEYFLAKLGDDQRNAHLILQRPEEYIRMLLQETRT